MLAALLAASLFPSQAKMAMPGVSAVAISQGRVFATSDDGTGRIFERGREVGRFAAGPHASKITVADLNGDGKLDLAVCNLGGPVQVLLGDASGLHEAERLAVVHALDVALGDLDGGGKADLAVAATDEVIFYTTR